MIDLSDGLVRDGGRLAAASGVVIDLDPTALTADVEALVDAAHALDADPWAWVLHGGEEHALLATVPTGPLPTGFRRLGDVRAPSAGESPGILLGGRPVGSAGFDHFA